MNNVALIGLESTGKSSLFNLITRSASSDERNFRGSTVYCREKQLPDGLGHLIDTPGIRYASDSVTTSMALSALQQSDIILLVMRANHAMAEWNILQPVIKQNPHRLAIILTFSDKIATGLDAIIQAFHLKTQAPVLALNVRHAGEKERLQLNELLRQVKSVKSTPINNSDIIPILNVSTAKPQRSWFEIDYLGPLLAVIALIWLFAAPVWLAWHISDCTQPLAVQFFIHPAIRWLHTAPAFIQALLTGSYGILSLGIYSFIWAFPVVFLIGLSVAVTEDSGIKERIIHALHPLMHKIGLSGDDLIPILSGFGCNVVAVFQSRSCSQCSRKNCISTIAFGSACSYQIGATLSIFSAAGQPELFAPYIALLFCTACLHTRLWHHTHIPSNTLASADLTWLQWPRWRAVKWSLKNMVMQFILQAMPIFIGICLVASVLDYYSIIDSLCHFLSPIAQLFHLPQQVMPGIIFSLLRKDGLMVLNQDNGTLIRSLNSGQLMLLVWLASTLMACLVTVITIGREISWRFATRLIIKQLISSLAVAVLFSLTLS
ncbi:TPA: ferrous iron transporter B [Klebsiella variicola]|uniref:nucleoside recognition domain-containing protein n=1 Tax=Klebsiella variicola TaxID=244366 RepID=UPI0007CCB6B3|nr:nucleoside recognition domain-containing protein [Klebsiella variicola]PXJ81785.1 ferrous iron transporter B [Klebsiella variicola]SBK83225.1 Ferrous iron transport protein B [Klebsiella variicola]HCL6959825.1 ferrous iron transporter B [Klebsiella variicola]